MKVSVAISITLHILVFVLIYYFNTKNVYNNDIALYFDDIYDITSSDISISKSSIENTTTKKKIADTKQEDSEGIDSSIVDDNFLENSLNIKTGQYESAVINGVINGVKLASPLYPALAKKRGLQGTTIVDIFIEKNGTVYDVKVVSSSGERILDNAVKETILKRWKLPPANQSLVVRKIFEFTLLD